MPTGSPALAYSLCSFFRQFARALHNIFSFYEYRTYPVLRRFRPQPRSGGDIRPLKPFHGFGE